MSNANKANSGKASSGKSESPEKLLATLQTMKNVARAKKNDDINADKLEKRKLCRKGDSVAKGSDVFGCRIGSETNIANAIMYTLTIEDGEFTNASVDRAVALQLHNDENGQCRPNSPHVATLVSLGYVEKSETPKHWRLTDVAVAMAQFAAKYRKLLCDDADLLASAASKKAK
jgi:hypothetical protein